ncbi:MAG: DnaD domain protein [Bacilli bacterium]|nr:DnaD domain protein [Bacilli bacterium]
MNDNILSLLQDKPIIVPRILFNNYKRLNIDEEELVVIMLIITLGNKIEYNPEIFVSELNMDRHKVMGIISNLMGKNILSLEVVKNGRKTEEYISLSLLYDKLLNIIKDVDEGKVEVDNSIFSIFENELGRLLSPMELEQIKEWINTIKSEELIVAALKEAVLNGVSNFRYMDAILNDWNKKGYNSREDIIKDKNNYRKKKSNIEIVDVDWLNDE